MVVNFAVSKTQKLFSAAVVALLALALTSTVAHAQGPEESCGAIYAHPNYSNVAVIDEPIDAAHGWVGPFDGDGRACFGDNVYTEYYKPLTVNELPDAHSSAIITLDGQVGYATGVVVASARLGNAQDVPLFDTGLCTTQDGCDFSMTGRYAQGVTYVREIRIVARSGRGGCLDHIRIAPTENIVSHSQAIPDADVDGVDYPAWHRVISSTLVEDYGSRIIGGALQITDQPVCTPIRLVQYTDTLSVSVAVMRNSWPDLMGAVVESMDDALSAEYGPKIYPQSATTYTIMTLAAKIAPNMNDGDGYLCLLTENNLSIVDWVAPLACISNDEEDCPTLTNADFTTTDAWTLNNTASIANAALHLPAPGDTATQPITITPGVYSVVISATGAAVSNTLIVGMAETSATIPVTNAPLWYIGTVLSTSTTGSTNFWLKSAGGDIDIGYVCYSASTLNPAGGYNTCLTSLLKNGEFNGPDNWDWFNGAAYNDTGGNAWLPYVISGTVQNMAVSGVRQFLSASPPAIGENERLVLQFDVRSPLNDATISARYWGVGVSNTIDMTYTVSANRNYTRYQTDFSQFADFNGWVGVGFLNTSYMYSQTEGAFVDNVCLMLTTGPITATQPVNDYYALPFNCANVSYWLSATLHINFPALEAMEAPSIWDVDQWVPWLASRLWVNVAKPVICVMVALFSSGSGLAILNFFDWAIRQPAIIFAWFGGWFNLFLADMGLWLLWFSGPVGRLFLFLYEMTRNSNTALGWQGAVVGWLWDALKLLLYWQFGMFINRMMTILNTLISAWNLIAPALATLWSGMVEIFIGIWNNWLVPFLSKFGAIGEFIIMAVNNIGLLGDLAAAFFAVVWQLALMVWGFITGVSELPIRFYFAFDNAVTGSAFQLIPNCAGDMANNWCRILFGLDVVNQAIAHSVGYPMVIVGIVVTTIIIFWRHIWELLSVRFG